jgi:hypothetical protein
MKVNKYNLDVLKIWWNIAFKEEDVEMYNRCREVWEESLGNYLEVRRYKKFGNVWKDFKLNDLVYVGENALNKDGILEYYYTKDDIIRICRDNKVVGSYVWRRLKGEKVEDRFKEELNKFYEYFIYEPTANIYKNKLMVSMFNVLEEDKKNKVLEVISKTTGKRR